MFRTFFPTILQIPSHGPPHKSGHLLQIHLSGVSAITIDGLNEIHLFVWVESLVCSGCDAHEVAITSDPSSQGIVLILSVWPSFDVVDRPVHWREEWLDDENLKDNFFTLQNIYLGKITG